MYKTKTTPLVSVFMPVYNAARFLPQALDSIQQQTYSHWELILVDDGSQDESWRIAQDFARQDQRIKVFRNKRNLGASATSNKAIHVAKGTFIAKMDADDIADSHRLERQLQYLLTHPSTVAVGGQCTIIDANNRPIGVKHFPTKPSEVRRMLFTFASVQHPTMMVNRSLLPSNFQWYDPTLKTAEEHELLFKLLQYGELANIPQTDLRYRFHGTNNSTKTPKKDFFIILKARLQAVRKYGYRPTLKSAFLLLAQFIVISLLPNRLIHPLYAWMRGLKSVPKTKTNHSHKSQLTKLSSLSVFFPMHNEAENVTRVIRSAQRVLPTLAQKYEIIIVNDGSTDRTSQIAHRLARYDHHIRVIDRKNIGYGGTIRTGFEAARYDWIFFSDGDLQFDLRELKKLVSHTATHQVILGYRKNRADHFQRLVLAKLLRVWNMIFFNFPHHIKDIDCAFKLFHRSVVQDIFPLTSRGAMISTELLLRIIDNGYPVTQVPVTHYPRLHGEQTGARWNVIRGAIKETWYLWRERTLQPLLEIRVPSLMRVFSALALVLYTSIKARS